MVLEEVLRQCADWADRLRPYVQPTEQIVQDLLQQGKNVLLEGAQGTLLDIDHGSYPYVTSSSPSIGGACTGLGLNPQAIAGVLGVFKAYSTRVGGGPMPSELEGEAADNLREKAQEYGTTTGRARRVVGSTPSRGSTVCWSTGLPGWSSPGWTYWTGSRR